MVSNIPHSLLDSMTLEAADNAFEAEPSIATAVQLLEVAMEYMADDELSTEGFIDYVSIVLDFLKAKVNHG